MDYTLIGSRTSPYVRRIRLVMENIPYEFQIVNLFSQEGQELIKQYSPIRRIPVLITQEGPVLDSNNIFEYINSSHLKHQFTFKDRNLLQIIDGAKDSFLTSMLIGKMDGQSEYSTYLQKRIFRCLSELNKCTDKFANWRYPSMALFSLLDWIKFRELYNLSEFKHLHSFWEKTRSKEVCKATQHQA